MSTIADFFTTCLSQRHGQEVHRHMTTRDLSRLFGVDSHDDGKL